MSIKTAVKAMESIEFGAALDVADNFRIFYKALRGHPDMTSLLDALQKAPTEAQTILDRIIALLPQNPEPEYAHPFDATLAGYLYGLQNTHPSLAHDAALQIMQTPNLWWARKMAEQVLAEPDSQKIPQSPQ